LKDISVTQRGESKTPKAPARDGYRSSGLDVLNIVRRLVESGRPGVPGCSFGAKTGDESLTEKPGTDQRLLTSSPTGEFTTADAYAFGRELEKLHPDNRHVRDNPVNNKTGRESGSNSRRRYAMARQVKSCVMLVCFCTSVVANGG
jgi:hypothetical protein